MTESNLQAIQLKAGAEWVRYGSGDDAVEIADTFGAYEAEYAAIRSRVGIMHLPQRGILRLVGKDVKDFLHRLTTQDVNAMVGGGTRRGFQLNVKGRIIADMLIHHGDADTWLDTDRCDIAELTSALDMRLFAEDVKMEDWSERYELLALHGPASGALLEKLGGKALDEPGTHHVMQLNGAPASVYRYDVCGSPGYGVWRKRDSAAALYQIMLDAAGYDPDAPDPETDPEAAADAAARRRETLRGRPVGWSAFNTARIEAGSPLFHVDFGGDCLPHETSLLDTTTSFTKGCYIGQEIVARMQSLGHPKRLLVGLRFEDDRLPVAGSQVFDHGDQSSVIGAITSSTISPMRGHTAIAFAMIKWGKHRPDTKVVVPADGQMVEAAVQGLRFIDP
jgi:folate-binding protein YgfZ